ncbi:MAG: DUF1343 domain-containing protein [Bacteroidetes bacterium]|nr:DUF1343 domain-containing protein [Bacteroidota bacterium]
MKYLFALMLLMHFSNSSAQSKTGHYTRSGNHVIMPGAERLNQYLTLLQNKRVAVFANHTSMVGKTHLVDTLKKSGVNVALIFGPEHGFRGDADAGEKIGNYTDAQTGIPVVSLYGSKRKPGKEDLQNIDVMIFDIQDVGLRYYTYISSLEYYLEAAIEHGKHLIVLDRPNPNGHYVDGPVLEKPFRSFIGMQSVPIVYGMTIGEYAQMLLGEGWYDASVKAKTHTDFELSVIPCNNYDHTSLYALPVKPSPNLPDMGSIYLYGSTCFFEGTVLSEGRGTPKPFQIFGHPSLPNNRESRFAYSFTPRSMDGAKNPKLKDQLCYGWNLSGTDEEVRKLVDNKVQLKWLLEAYQLFPQKDSFFLRPKSGKMEDYFFNKLAGNATLMQQIISGTSEADIRKSWLPGLENFKSIRKKYLLYKDFE